MLEITAVTTVHSAAGIMRCVIEESNGTRKETKVCVFERYINQCVLSRGVQRNQKVRGKGAKHATSAYHVLASGPVEENREKV